MLSKEVNFPLLSILSLVTESVHSQQNLSSASHHRSILLPVESHRDMPQETGGIPSCAFFRGKNNLLVSCLFLCKNILTYHTLLLTAVFTSEHSVFIIKQARFPKLLSLDASKFPIRNFQISLLQTSELQSHPTPQ